MEPWQSWVLALGIGSAAALYYSQSGKQAQAAARRASTVVEQVETAVTSKRKQSKQKSATPGKSILVDSATSEARQRKADNKRGPSHQRGPSVTFGTEADTAAATTTAADQAQEDEDWALQLQANKRGVAITSASNNANSAKKQSKKNKQAKEQPTAFPDEPSSASALSSSKDVSDMLEPAAPGPSVIRITGEEKAKEAVTTPSATAPQETKKQRQNRKKAEEKKLQRERDEQERQALLEKQRRTARESRGEPARNGLGAAAGPANSAWSAPTANPVVNGAATPGVAAQVPLLDTFEPEGSSGPRAAVAETPATVVSSLGQNIPSEETQMEMLNELNGWAEVPSKAKKSKKDKKAQDGASAVSAPVIEAPSAEPSAKAESKYANVASSELIGGKKSGKNIASANGFAALEAATEYTPSAKGHPQDSDWAAN